MVTLGFPFVLNSVRWQETDGGKSNLKGPSYSKFTPLMFCDNRVS